MEFENETESLKLKLLDVAATNSYTKAYILARVISQSKDKRAAIKTKRTKFESEFASLSYCEMFVKSGLLWCDLNGIRLDRTTIKDACDELIEKIHYIAFMDLDSPNKRGRVI
jgi:hypothetical protein